MKHVCSSFHARDDFSSADNLCKQFGQWHLSSADSLCKEFGPRSGPTKSKQFDADSVLVMFSEQVNL